MSCRWYTGEPKCPSYKQITEFEVAKIIFQRGHLSSILSVTCIGLGNAELFCSHENLILISWFSDLIPHLPFFLFPSVWLFHQYFLSLCSVPHSLFQHYQGTHHILWISSAKRNRGFSFKNKQKRKPKYYDFVLLKIHFSMDVGWDRLVNFGCPREGPGWDGATQESHNAHVGMTNPWNKSSVAASVSHGPMGWGCFQPNLWDCKCLWPFKKHLLHMIFKAF